MIPGPYKIPTKTPSNPSDLLRRRPFGASCRLPICRLGRQRHPPQSGYRTRPYSVRLHPIPFMRIAMVSATIALLLAVLTGVIATFGPTVFMLQSRHHGIDDHERKLQEKFDLLIQSGSSREAEAQNVLDQIEVVRKRYNAALLAFILLMFQQVLLVVTAICIAVNSGIMQPIYILIVLPGVLAFVLHIFGDLVPAFKTQKRSRAWLDARVDRSVGLRVRRSPNG